MITDISYYDRQPLFIPSSQSVPDIGDNTPNQVDNLHSYIETMEYRFLLGCLGYEGATDLMSQFEVNGDLKPSAPQKWKDLVNGKTLTDGRRWNGLRFVIGDTKVSLIAYYVYYHFRIDDNSFYTNVGEQKPLADNSVSISIDAILATRWNEFIEMYQGVNSYFNPFFWNGFYGVYDWSCSTSNQSVSLLEFLQSDVEVYTTEFFTHFGLKNRFGL